MFRGQRRRLGGNQTGRRKYGYFRCPKCNGHWESANVYIRQGNQYYTQDCKKCNVACSPYRVEAIRCSICQETECICTEEEREARHVDPNKPHRSDLCQKCRSGKPCGASMN